MNIAEVLVEVSVENQINSQQGTSLLLSLTVAN